MVRILFAAATSWAVLATSFMDACSDDSSGGSSSGDSSGGSPSSYDGELENLASYAGDFAYDYLTDQDYDSLVVEIDYVQGREPGSEALADLQDALETYLNKPGGITLLVDDELPDHGSPEWTHEAAEDQELQHRDLYHDPSRREAAMYLLYLDGNTEYDSSTSTVLAYAYHGSSIILFADSIEAADTLPPHFSGAVEATVAVHELGHLIGLVNNGIPMVHDHQDPDPNAGSHDVSDDCIMHWSVETGRVSDLVRFGKPTFDDACEADILAAGGRAP